MSQFDGNNFVWIKWHIIASTNFTNYAALNNSYIFNFSAVFKNNSYDLIAHSGFRLGH